MLIFEKEKYTQIPFFPRLISDDTSNDAVGLMMVVTLCSCVTCISLQAVQTLLAAFKAAPRISYGDEDLIYSCENERKQRWLFKFQINSFPSVSALLLLPSADTNTLSCFISILFSAAVCKHCQCFPIPRH